MNKTWIAAAILLALVAITIYGNVSSDATVSAKPQEGFKAPDFTLPALEEGVEYALRQTDKPLVLNFWASWCKPCHMEAPELVRLYEKYEGKVEIYAVNVTVDDHIPQARRFVEQYDFAFPVLMDQSGSVSSEYNVRALPTTYFIDREGIIIKKVDGLLSPKQMESMFQTLADAS